MDFAEVPLGVIIRFSYGVSDFSVDACASQRMWLHLPKPLLNIYCVSKHLNNALITSSCEKHQMALITLMRAMHLSPGVDTQKPWARSGCKNGVLAI